MFPEFKCFSASAMPVAIGNELPTMGTLAIKPTVLSKICIDPPLPLQQPSGDPINSESIIKRSPPLAR